MRPLSNFDWDIMRIVCEVDRITAREVHEKLKSVNPRAITTVQTYLERLTDKGYLKKEKIGMTNFYYATIQETKIKKQEAQSFKNRVFEGSFLKMASFLFNSQDIDEDVLNQIEQIIENKKRENA